MRRPGGVGGQKEGAGGGDKRQYKPALMKEKISIIHVVLAVVCH